jgi:hypothetical protein
MIFSRKHAGKWVASKNGRVVASSGELGNLLKRVERRKDAKNVRFDKVPRATFVGPAYGVSIY